MSRRMVPFLDSKWSGDQCGWTLNAVVCLLLHRKYFQAWLADMQFFKTTTRGHMGSQSMAGQCGPGEIHTPFQAKWPKQQEAYTETILIPRPCNNNVGPSVHMSATARKTHLLISWGKVWAVIKLKHANLSMWANFTLCNRSFCTKGGPSHTWVGVASHEKLKS